MPLQAELNQVTENQQRDLPKSVTSVFRKAREDFKESYDAEKAPQVGQKLPFFTLIDAEGKEVTR